MNASTNRDANLAMNAALRAPKWLRIGPIARISLGLVALIVSLVLAADLLLGMVPGQAERQQAVRQRIAENLAMQFTTLLEVGDTATLGKTIRQVLARDADLLTITVRRTDGSTLMQHGRAGSPAGAAAEVAASTANRLRVPVYAGRKLWGEIDLRFVPAEPATLRGWLAQPFLQLMLVLGLGGFALCYAYLRRAMQTLNPSASVPDRVRSAFDSLSEGLLILDLQGRIVLANKAFRQLHPDADGDLTGRAIDALAWLKPGSGEPAAVWADTLGSGRPVTAQPLTLAQPDAEPTRLLVSSAAITDHRGRTRGCLITFDNVTAVHRANDELRQTLTQLERSRQLIEEQNEELRRLASRDALTGCYNRRAFFEIVETLYATARAGRGPLCCLMVDIDHFKQFNDRFGHALGDKVIQVVARALAAGLRQPDVLGRYGGEEFCIVLPGIAPADALALADRIRMDVEATAHRAIRDADLPPITCSFGLAAINDEARTIAALIDQADQALYQSKRNGRNRVTPWQATAPVAAPDALAAAGG